MSHGINISIIFDNDDNDDSGHYMTLQDSSFEEERDAIIANMKMSYTINDKYCKLRGGLRKGKAPNKELNLALGNIILVQVSVYLFDMFFKLF